MPSFADSFWSDDFLSGLEILFKQLRDGCDRSDHFIQLFASRMQFEVSYGRQLCGIQKGVDNKHTEADLGISSVDDALIKIVKQTEIEGDRHLNIASSIQSLVLEPFSTWCCDLSLIHI